jgi:hypothetical protein
LNRLFSFSLSAEHQQNQPARSLAFKQFPAFSVYKGFASKAVISTDF